MVKQKLKAKPGLIIRDPNDYSILSDKEWTVKTINIFWKRRIKSGDVLVKEQQAERKATSNEKFDVKKRKSFEQIIGKEKQNGSN